MSLIAKYGDQDVITELQYREGRPDVRRYDACYYIIKAMPDISPPGHHGEGYIQPGIPSIVVKFKVL